MIRYHQAPQYSLPHLASLNATELRDMQREASDVQMQAHIALEKINQAIALKYKSTIEESQKYLDRDKDNFRFTDDGVLIEVTFHEVVQWDQDKLACIDDAIRRREGDPSEYLDIQYAISDARWADMAVNLKEAFRCTQVIVREGPFISFKED